MFFIAAKSFWFLATPSNSLLLLALAGLAGSQTRWRRFGMGLTGSAIVLLLICGLCPIGYWLALPLEERFPRLAFADVPKVDAIIVLGGGVDDRLASARVDRLEVSAAGARVLAAVALARLLPDTPIVYSGGTVLEDTPEGEAAVFKRLIGTYGIDPQRVIAENLSRDTFENAVFSREALKPLPESRYLLVTSAWHMPRAVGTFRRQGLHVIPFPVDYRTAGRQDLTRFFIAGADGLELVDTATKEWVGLVAYRLAGRSDAPFPGP